MEKGSHGGEQLHAGWKGCWEPQKGWRWGRVCVFGVGEGPGCCCLFRGLERQIAQWLRAGAQEADRPPLNPSPRSRHMALRKLLTSLRLSFFICMMGLVMVTVMRTERLHINYLALCQDAVSAFNQW